MILDAAKAFIAPYMIWVKLGAAAILIAFLAYQWHAHNIKVDAAGYARGHAELVSYQAQVTTETNRRLAENAAKDAQATANNEVKINELQATNATIAADRDQLSRRLFEYARKGIGSIAMPQADDHSGAVAGAGESSGEAAIEQLTTYDQACQRDAARYHALIAELKPQLAF